MSCVASLPLNLKHHLFLHTQREMTDISAQKTRQRCRRNNPKSLPGNPTMAAETPSTLLKQNGHQETKWLWGARLWQTHPGFRECWQLTVMGRGQTATHWTETWGSGVIPLCQERLRQHAGTFTASGGSKRFCSQQSSLSLVLTLLPSPSSHQAGRPSKLGPGVMEQGQLKPL